ncbi:MAG: thiamine-phosphate pyrophosphorylase [Candidatus Omnitrophica bacterium]|nr:thiamine-phosphate pyrophosphorylase [Candidatus Omnitrophota bacterium]
MSKQNILRLIDANTNRAKEGLRVCEDVLRFVYDDAALTMQLKQLRHRVTVLLGAYRGPPFVFLKQRAVARDVGRPATPRDELRRRCPADIFFANAQRAKESVRVLEEFFKLLDVKISLSFKRLRYRLYAVERAAVRVFEKKKNGRMHENTD